MLKIACLLFLLLTGFAQAQDFPKEFEEPSMDKLIEWIPEEVPRTVSFYFDTDGDGVSDLIVAYSLIESYECGNKCDVEIQTFADHWILVTPTDIHPYSYYVIKRWTYWRNSKREDWKSVGKTSGSVYKYKTNEEWYENEFLKRKFY
jgi:hypothetical protein